MVGLGIASPAAANTEVPAFDARAVGLGGNSVSYVDNASALYINPAALGLVPKFSAQVTASPLFATLSGPAGNYTMDGYRGYLQTKDQDPKVAPLYFVGAAYRVHDRVVLGLGNWVSSGFGGKFSNFGGDALRTVAMQSEPITLDASVAQGEVALGVSYQASDQIFFGASYRVTYAMMDMAIVDTVSQRNLKLKDFSGANFTGFSLSVLLRPTDQLRVGITYRSETQIHLDGDLTTSPLLGPGMANTRSAQTQFTTPHLFRAGVSWQIVPQLMWTFGAHYLTYANRWRELAIRDHNGLTGQPTQLQWKDVFAGGTGFEVTPLPRIPFQVRVGAQMTRSATNPDYPNVFFMPPGLMGGASGGCGYTIRDWVRVDGAVVYNWANGRGRNSLEDSGLVTSAQPSDKYGYRGYMGSLSVTVQH